jgi:peptide deformylase
MILPILTQHSPILRQISKEIKEVTPEVKKYALDMIETMKNSNGVGLAAPQIGCNIRLIVIEYKKNSITMINPIIQKKSILENVSEEGCLSIPGTFGNVKRHTNIVVEMTDLSGNKQTIKAKGMFARIIQHEIDHLDGVLFTDKVLKLTKLSNVI